MTVGDIISVLEDWATPSLQESYDNSRLLTGTKEQVVTQALCSLDCTESVVNEAIKLGCQLIIAHHPVIFGKVKHLVPNNYVNRTLVKAIQNDIAIYAIHTNLDNVIDGVNSEIASRLGLINCSILSPKESRLRKLVTFIPTAQTEAVRLAMFEAGAGTIGQYDHCSFNVTGTGTFRGGENTNPHVGKVGEDHSETENRVEVIYPIHRENSIVNALVSAHPYEEVAYDIYPLQNLNPQVGAGLIGELESEMDESDFLEHVTKSMKCRVIRHTDLRGKGVQKVAICGGSGSFLLRNAIGAKADVFITGDFKYHDFFDAEGKTVIMDIGHFESEQFTPHLVQRYLQEKIPTFAVLLSEVNTNPVNYFIS